MTMTPETRAELLKRVAYVNDYLDEEMSRRGMTEDEILSICQTSERDAYKFARALKSFLSLTAPADAAEHGWHCPNCGIVPGNQVTFYEHHEACGAKVSDRPAPADAEKIAGIRMRASLFEPYEDRTIDHMVCNSIPEDRAVLLAALDARAQVRVPTVDELARKCFQEFAVFASKPFSFDSMEDQYKEEWRTNARNILSLLHQPAPEVETPASGRMTLSNQQINTIYDLLVRENLSGLADQMLDRLTTKEPTP